MSKSGNILLIKAELDGNIGSESLDIWRGQRQ